MPPIVAAAAAAFTTVQGAVAAAGIMKSMAVAGTAMSALGAVTKNEKLMKIGAVVGTVGSLGTMGAFGQGAKTLGMNSSARAAANAAAATAAAPAATQTLSRQALQPGAGVLHPSFGGGAVQQPGLLSQTMQGLSTVNLPPPGPPPTLLQKFGGALSSGAQMVKDNPEVAIVLAQGGAELANYLSGKTDAQIRELESSINANDANAQRTLFTIAEEKRRRANIQGAYLPAQVAPAQPAPMQSNPYQPAGLIAGAMPRGV
jgi:hypothetical protein